MTPLELALALSLSQRAPDVETLKRTVAVESAAVERSPEDAEALYRLGLAHLSLGEARKAIRPLEALVKAAPDDVDGKLLLARAYRAAGEVDKARALLDDALKAVPEDPSLHAERAQLARATDDLAFAVSAYQRAVELSPNDADLVFNLGEAQQASRALEDAIASYQRALALRPDFTGAKVNLGKALAEKGLFGQAKEVLASVNKETLADAEAHYNLGVILMREGAVAAAATEFERALAINPRHAQALNNLGVAFDARGDHRKALDSFRRAASADPTSAEAFFNQGMSLLRLDQVPQATKAFEQALKLEPGASGPYVELGGLYLKQGRKDRALEAYTRAIAAAEEEERRSSGFLQLRKLSATRRTTDAYRGLALTYLSLGKAADAVATLKKAVEKLPRDASARAALGEACLAQGDVEGAVAQFTERLALEPTPDARLDLARAYAKKRVSRQAEPLYREVLKNEPDNRGARMGLTDLYVSMGRFADAEAMLKAALEADGSDLQALSRLGILKSRMGRPNEALEPLEQVVRQNPLLYDARAEYAFLLFRGDPTAADRCVATLNDVLTAEPRHALSLHYLGVCLYAKGDTARAEASFKAALDVDPGFAAALFSLGELSEHAGRKDDARKSYQAAATLGHAEAAEAVKRLK